MVDLLDDLIKNAEIEQISDDEGLNFDRDRVEILKAMRSIDVQACPGSGKTTLIAAKLILLAKKWPFIGQGICVLSHTNVAKDEIIARLKQSKTPEARRLLSYPHFIGTIQEFVGKFLAFPFLRSDNIEINTIDTDICVGLIEAKLDPKTKSYLLKKMQYSNVLYDFNLTYENGKILINVPTFKKPSESDAYQDLKKIRCELKDGGYFFYRDAYVFAQNALDKNKMLSGIIQKRFPLVLIDEMQDTQKFQDNLLCQIFPRNNSNVIVQRFGDPDQAIFQGINKEKINDSFNDKRADDMDFVIKKSHRFGDDLARKISPLSVNKIELSTDLSNIELNRRLTYCADPNGFQHCIIIFDKNTIGNVISKFGDIVSAQFKDSYKATEAFTVKALGAVGNKIDPEGDHLKIGHYWHFYSKNSTKSASKAENFIDVVRNVRQASTFDFSDNYKLLMDAIIKWLNLAGNLDKDSRSFLPKSLQFFLQENGNWTAFREILYSLLVEDKPLTADRWHKLCNNLKSVFGLKKLPTNAEKYLNYHDNTLTYQDAAGDPAKIFPLPENKIRHPDGFDIQLSTIHGVKGETHDATLIMETKNRYFDVGYLIGQIARCDTAVITGEMNLKFARQLYVAASRPRYLLCIAVREDHIEEKHKQNLAALGWKVISLPQEGTATCV